MRRLLAAALLLLCACAAPSCVGVEGDYSSEARLRRRAGGFYSAWVKGDLKTAARYLSHNFHCNDPRLLLFAKMMRENRPCHVLIGDVETELKMKRLTVEITGQGEKRRTQVTCWIFERGDWYLEVLD